MWRRVAFVLALMATAVVAAELTPEQDSALASTKKDLRGRILSVNDEDGEDYEQARSTLLWNPDPTLQNSPAYIVQCDGANDVKLAIQLAKVLGLQISVRGGGHNVRGLASNDGGLVIDLRNMNSVRVNADEKYAWAEPGCHLSEVHKETAARGLLPATGTIGCTGVAGLTAGGGFNYFSRTMGFAVDNLMEVEMVTADGEFVVASADKNPDLFWAIRGGGGAFGVITAFKLQLHEVPREVYGGMYMVEPQHCMTQFERIGKFYESSSENEMAWQMWMSPDGVNTMCGAIIISKQSPEKGKKAFAPLRDGTPIALDMVQTMPILDFVHSNDPGFCTVPGNYWTSIPFTRKSLFSKAGKEWIEAVNKTRPVGGIIGLEPWSGADAAGRKVTEEGGREPATAFSARSAEVVVMLIGMFDPSSEKARAEMVTWVKQGKQAASKLAMQMEYSGYTSEEVDPASTRLRAVKLKWDPDNIFNRTQFKITPLANDPSTLEL